MFQLDCPKAFNQPQNLQCEIHQECQLQMFSLGENKEQKSRILCIKCLIELNNYQEENRSPYIYLNDFVTNPVGSLLDSLEINKCRGKRLSETQVLDEMEEQINQFQAKIHNQIQAMRQCLEQMRGTLREFSWEYSKQLNLNEVVKQIQILKQMDSTQGSQELKEFEGQLENLSQCCEEIYINVKYQIYDNQTQVAKNIINNSQIIKKDIDQLIQNQKDQLNKIMFPINEDIKEFPLIHYKISGQKSIQFEQIYQGSKDGLNAKSYWNKCDYQSHLLTLMTSKNGNKFGCYIPCQLQKSLNDYVADPSLKSFIFQYNKKEIYQLKNRQNACYCNYQYGPNLGKRNDLQIMADFQDGCSNIGDRYDTSKYNILDIKTHIFGDLTPQLIECKVYKLIFDK